MSNNTVFVFDFDGVIVDSINALYDAYMEFLSQFGITGYQEEFNLLNGPKLSEIVLFLKEKYALKKTESELLKIYLKKISLVYKDIKLNDGIEEILTLLKSKNFTIALASSSKKSEVKSILNKYKLEKFFDLIITGDDVLESKPSPEIYNTVKKSLHKHKYYAIEDSKNGVIAAMSAGMTTILYNPERKEMGVESSYEIYCIKQIKNVITEFFLNCFTIAKAKEITLKVIPYKININSNKAKSIETIWNNALKTRELFNGKIVSYKSHDKSNNILTIECFITQYKYFFAQLISPELNLPIYPIGVSGIIIDVENNTLLAARNNVTEYDGYYELLPAGSIDLSRNKNNAVSFQDQLITEFEEESNIAKDNILRIEPYCIIFDKNHKVYDICSKIYINGLINNLLSSKESEEYRSIKAINLSSLHNKIEENRVVPTSVVIFNNLD